MKKSLPLVVFVFLISTYILAQNNIDPLSVKKKEGGTAVGGRRIPLVDRPRGKEVHPEGPISTIDMPKRVPELRLETKTVEGNVFKEGLQSVGKTTDSEGVQSSAPSQRYLNRWYRNISGLRAFYDPLGGTIGLGQHANHRLETYVAVGYQFNPILFLGVGQGYQLSLNKKESAAPTFMNFRINFLDEDTTPFFDFKAGYSFLGGEGLFMNPNFGVSFGKGKRAWNMNAGYSFQKVKFRDKHLIKKEKYHGISLRFTYEFSLF